MKQLLSTFNSVADCITAEPAEQSCHNSSKLTIDKRAVVRLLDAYTRIDARMRMLVNRQGRLLAANSGIDEMFDAGSCLNRANGVVDVSQPGYKKRLKAFVPCSRERCALAGSAMP